MNNTILVTIIIIVITGHFIAGIWYMLRILKEKPGDIEEQNDKNITE